MAMSQEFLARQNHKNGKMRERKGQFPAFTSGNQGPERPQSVKSIYDLYCRFARMAVLSAARQHWIIRLAAFSALRARAAGFWRFCFGLALCFSHRSAKIEAVPATPILACPGGGWIDMGLVIMDRLWTPPLGDTQLRVSFTPQLQMAAKSPICMYRLLFASVYVCTGCCSQVRYWRG
jgi:hypothetical protein